MSERVCMRSSLTNAEFQLKMIIFVFLKRDCGVTDEHVDLNI